MAAGCCCSCPPTGTLIASWRNASPPKTWLPSGTQSASSRPRYGRPRHLAPLYRLVACLVNVVVVVVVVRVWVRPQAPPSRPTVPLGDGSCERCCCCCCCCCVRVWVRCPRTRPQLGADAHFPAVAPSGPRRSTGSLSNRPRPPPPPPGETPPRQVTLTYAITSASLSGRVPEYT